KSCPQRHHLIRQCDLFRHLATKVGGVMRLQALTHSKLSRGFVLTAILLLTPAVLSAQEIIAFESQRDGNPEVYVTNVDGTNQRRLTFNSSFDGEPAFT